jgi:hypothetical protein
MFGISGSFQEFLGVCGSIWECLEYLGVLRGFWECLEVSEIIWEYCLRLPRILGVWPEFVHLESENMVPYWVPDLGPEIRGQLKMTSFPLEFMLATS